MQFVNEQVNEQVNRQNKIINILKHFPNITLKQLAEKVDVSNATVRRDMEALKLNRKIKRVGSDKAGYWEVLSE